jgi:hypothetical protein
MHVSSSAALTALIRNASMAASAFRTATMKRFVSYSPWVVSNNTIKAACSSDVVGMSTSSSVPKRASMSSLSPSSSFGS